MRSDGGRPPRSRRESGEGHHGDEVVRLSVFAVPRGEIKLEGNHSAAAVKKKERLIRRKEHARWQFLTNITAYLLMK